MFRCNDYVFVGSIEEAYELNQKKNNVVIGGNGWLKMGSKQWGTAIDLSRLGLDKIEESDDEFIIGAMVTLRQLETDNSFNAYTNGAVKDCLKHIVGNQFRNSATIGGSIYGRFGFSDPLTLFLVMDSYVELYKGGLIPLEEFAKMPYDNDILVKIIVKKTPMKIAYDSFRNQSTDFPVITCAVSSGNKIKVAVGARPKRAEVMEYKGDIKDFSQTVADSFNYSDNMRASAKYRKELTNVLAKRIAERLGM